MSRKLRIILIVAAVLLVILVIAPFLIPVNQFKPVIEAKASEALGRKVEMGNLGLSLWSGSLTAENLSVSDDPKFSPTPFLTAKKIRVGVEVMPLIFSRALNITGVTIDEPQVTLLHNASGVWNYSSIGGSAANAQKSSGSSSDVAVKKVSLDNGTIIVGSTANAKRSTYDHVSVTAEDLSARAKFPVKVSANLPGGGTFKLEGSAGPIDEKDASLTPLDAKLKIDNLNIASTGFLEPNTGLGGLLDLDATLSSAKAEAQTKGTAKLSKALFIQGGTASSVPLTVNFDTKYNLEKENGVLNPSAIKIGGATANLSGTYNTAGEATAVNVKVDGQNMPAKDLENFLPALGINVPKGASLQAGTLSTNLALNGPTNNLVTTGNVGLFNAKLAGFDLGSKMSAVGSLAGLKTGKDLSIEKMTTNLRMAREGLKADNFVAVLPELGDLNGAGTVDAKNNLDFKMVAKLKAGVAGAVGAPAAMATGALGQVLGGGASGCKNGGMTVPFQIQGTTSDPKFVPDVGGLAAGMLKSQLGCAGNATTALKNPAQLQKPADAIGNLGGLFKKKKP
jgi:AsmA protein